MFNNFIKSYTEWAKMNRGKQWTWIFMKRYVCLNAIKDIVCIEKLLNDEVYLDLQNITKVEIYIKVKVKEISPVI